MQQQLSTSALSQKLDALALEECARATGFVKYPPKKVTPKSFLAGYLKAVLNGESSLRNLAIHIGFYAEDTVSKQAVDKRINETCGQFLEQVLLQALLQQAEIPTKWARAAEIFLPLQQVLVQDSTCIALREKVVETFPGPRNQHGQHAMAKIQTLLDLRCERFVHFELTPDTQNDQSMACKVLSFAQPGDLVLRDLGYFSVAAFHQMAQRGIYFLSRLLVSTALFDAATGASLPLLERLQEQGTIDQIVGLGAKARMPVRLVAQSRVRGSGRCASRGSKS